MQIVLSLPPHTHAPALVYLNYIRVHYYGHVDNETGWMLTPIRQKGRLVYPLSTTCLISTWVTHVCNSSCYSHPSLPTCLTLTLEGVSRTSTHTYTHAHRNKLKNNSGQCRTSSTFENELHEFKVRGGFKNSAEQHPAPSPDPQSWAPRWENPTKVQNQF